MTVTIRSIFDKLKWVKGEWHSHSWDDTNRNEVVAYSYDTEPTEEGQLSCNGVCAMGAIHVALGRTVRYNTYYGSEATYMERDKWIEQQGEAVRLRWFREMLQDVGDLIAGQIFGQWALEQVDDAHTYSYGYNAKHYESGIGDIVSWNDADATTEAQVMAFFDVLDGYPRFHNLTLLLDMSDSELYEEFEAYWSHYPQMMLHNIEEHAEALVATRAI